MSGSPRRWPLLVLLGLVLVVPTWVVAFRPDRPIAHLEPGSSAGPRFRVQVIRPRLGLPVGGLLPPGWFGVDGSLSVDARQVEDAFATLGAQRVELRAEGWEVLLVLDAEGRVTEGSEVVFEMIFEEHPRRVRCRPQAPIDGYLRTTELAEGAELAGQFEFPVEGCEDASTGESLGWPPQPLVLRGSFDRLPVR